MRRFIAIGLASTLLLQVTPVFAATVRQPRARMAQAADVTIDGKAQFAKGQAPPQHLQLRNLETGQLVATTTCNSQGDFSFARRRPGRYSVEVVNPSGAIVATSAALTVPAGATANVTVAPAIAPTLTTTAAGMAASSGVAAAGGASTASIVTTTAAAAGIPGVVAAARNHPSPSY